MAMPKFSQVYIKPESNRLLTHLANQENRTKSTTLEIALLEYADRRNVKSEDVPPMKPRSRRRARGAA